MAAAVHAIRRQKIEAARINDTFLKYDADGSGAIDKGELMDALADLGMKLTKQEANVGPGTKTDVSCQGRRS